MKSKLTKTVLISVIIFAAQISNAATSHSKTVNPSSNITNANLNTNTEKTENTNDNFEQEDIYSEPNLIADSLVQTYCKEQKISSYKTLIETDIRQNFVSCGTAIKSLLIQFKEGFLHESSKYNKMTAIIQNIEAKL